MIVLLQIVSLGPNLRPGVTALDLWKFSINPANIDEVANEQQTCMHRFAKVSSRGLSLQPQGLIFMVPTNYHTRL